MKCCEKCVLNDNMPSVTIDETGLCNYCSRNEKEQKKNTTEEKDFIQLCEENKDKDYQVLVAYSGGKDSTYLLKLLREKYNIKILAITFDNGFLSDMCKENINHITNELNVDSIIVKYPKNTMIKSFKYVAENEIFRGQTIERASDICNMCITFIKNIIVKEAVIRDIPIICYGWTPGQVNYNNSVLKLPYKMIEASNKRIRDQLHTKVSNEFDAYLSDDKFYEKYKDKMPYLYYPFVANYYDEKMIYNEIASIGWKHPKETDSNSSNCRLNAYANNHHMCKYKFHPYAHEISGLIRKGLLSREEGLKKIESSGSNEIIKEIDKVFKENT